MVDCWWLVGGWQGRPSSDQRRRLYGFGRLKAVCNIVNTEVPGLTVHDCLSHGTASLTSWPAGRLSGEHRHHRLPAEMLPKALISPRGCCLALVQHFKHGAPPHAFRIEMGAAGVCPCPRGVRSETA